MSSSWEGTIYYDQILNHNRCNHDNHKHGNHHSWEGSQVFRGQSLHELLNPSGRCACHDQHDYDDQHDYNNDQDD